MPPARPDAGAEESHDPHFERHGYTAEDESGIGHGEEGFLAEEYPGHNPLRGEGERPRRHREAVTWSWPRVPEVEREIESEERSDERICREIGRRIERAKARPVRIVVRVLDGEVSMDGTVEGIDDLHVIEGVARTVEGVRGLDSRLVTANGTGVRTDSPAAPRRGHAPDGRGA